MKLTKSEQFIENIKSIITTSKENCLCVDSFYSESDKCDYRLIYVSQTGNFIIGPNAVPFKLNDISVMYREQLFNVTIRTQGKDLDKVAREVTIAWEEEKERVMFRSLKKIDFNIHCKLIELYNDLPNLRVPVVVAEYKQLISEDGPVVNMIHELDRETSTITLYYIGEDGERNIFKEIDFKEDTRHSWGEVVKNSIVKMALYLTEQEIHFGSK